MEIFGVPLQGMLSQLLLGLVNGSFYAMLSLGLATLSIPLAVVLFFWAGAIGGLIGVALAVVLFLALRGDRSRAWFSEQ